MEEREKEKRGRNEREKSGKSGSKIHIINFIWANMHYYVIKINESAINLSIYNWRAWGKATIKRSFVLTAAPASRFQHYTERPSETVHCCWKPFCRRRCVLILRVHTLDVMEHENVCILWIYSIFIFFGLITRNKLRFKREFPLKMCLIFWMRKKNSKIRAKSHTHTI